MVYDTLENLSQYTGMFDHLDTAIEFIQNHDLNDLPFGKTEIDGENVFVNVTETDTLPAEGRAFETHSNYMDLHIDLCGEELCEVALGKVTEEKPYDEAEDCALWNADTTCGLVLGEGRFAVFMVEEPHKPLIRAAGSAAVRKAVFKIAY